MILIHGLCHVCQESRPSYYLFFRSSPPWFWSIRGTRYGELSIVQAMNSRYEDSWRGYISIARLQDLKTSDHEHDNQPKSDSSGASAAQGPEKSFFPRQQRGKIGLSSGGGTEHGRKSMDGLICSALACFLSRTIESEQHGVVMDLQK